MSGAKYKRYFVVTYFSWLFYNIANFGTSDIFLNIKIRLLIQRISFVNNLVVDISQTQGL